MGMFLIEQNNKITYKNGVTEDHFFLFAGGIADFWSELGLLLVEGVSSE